MSEEGSRILPADSKASTGVENAVSSYSHPSNTVLSDPITQGLTGPVHQTSQPSESTSSPSSAVVNASTTLQPPSNDLGTSQSATSVPVRTSSNSRNQSSISPIAKSDNAKGLIQKISRGSLKPKSRTGSLASSNKAADGTVVTGGAGSPKKKLKIFGFLNCCAGSDHANNYELTDQAVPAKKTPIPQSGRDRQAAPDLSSSTKAKGGSVSTYEQPGNPSIGGPPYSQLPAAVQPKTQPTGFDDSKATQQPMSESGGQPPTEGDSSLNSDPRLPTAIIGNPEGDMSQKRDSSTLVDGKGNAETPEPSIKVSEPQGTEQENLAINDRTPQQQRHDVQMEEAPPLPSDVTPLPEKRNSAISSLPLPPPPPRPVSIAREVTPDQRSSTGASQENQQWLLKPLEPRDRGKKCLVLDLDETLVHSSFKILHQADFTIPVEIEGQYHNVYVIKRPGVDEFMRRVGELYEVVVFTASVSKYGQPLLDQLDIHQVVRHRLYRESCYNHQGNYVKDLSQIGRDLRETIIIDNSPTSYIFHPQHAVPISSWFSDAHDNELLDLIPVLEDLAGDRVRDVSLVLDVAL